MNGVVDSEQWMFFNRGEVEMNKAEVVREIEGGEELILAVARIVEGIVAVEGVKAVNVAIPKGPEELDQNHQNQNSLRFMTDGKNSSSRNE